MKKIEFTKMVAAGNDFVVIEGYKVQGTRYRLLAKNICDRKFGVGADGLLVLEKTPKADVRMRIFNADGSEAEMCGNGARCAALYTALKLKKQDLHIQTLAGMIKGRVKGNNVRVQLTQPKDLKLGLIVNLGRILRVNFINTGVPHAVIFVESIEKLDVVSLGRQLRFHKVFAPRGTNVDFVEVLSPNRIKVRTYERGVEDETLACGTGVTASALITAIKLGKRFSNHISVMTKSNEALKVYFNYRDNKFSDVWLEGKVSTICQGVYYV